MNNLLRVLALTLALSTVNIAGAWAGEWQASYDSIVNSWSVTNGEQTFRVTDEKSAKQSAKALNKADKKAQRKAKKEESSGSGFIADENCQPTPLHSC